VLVALPPRAAPAPAPAAEAPPPPPPPQQQQQEEEEEEEEEEEPRVAAAAPPRPAAVTEVAAPARGGGGGGPRAAPAPPPPPPPPPPPAPTPAVVPNHARAQYRHLLQAGCTFTKYGRAGFPHKRRVWLTPEMDALRWAKPGGREPPALRQAELAAGKECIRLSEIVDVMEEPSTPVFLRNARSIGSADCCFAITATDRTLDLEAESPEVKAKWVVALLALKRYRGGL
jgi:hypothetical protein